MTAKLKTKYEVQSQCEAFFTGSKIQITENGQELLCDCEEHISIVDVNTGQASKQATLDSKEKLTLVTEEAEAEDIQDSFKNSRIELEDDDDRVTSFKLSPDGKKLAIACKSLLLKLYSWPERSLLQQFRSFHRAPILCLAWDASSTLLLSGSSDHTARVWDTVRSCSTHCLRDAAGVLGCLLFHPMLNTQPLVFAGVANILFVWKLSAGNSELLHRIDDAHYMNISCLLHTSDGKHLVSCGLDKVAILWDSATMAQIRVVIVGQSVGAAILLPSASEDGSSAVSVLLGGETGYLSVWRLNEAREEFRSPEPVVQPPPATAKGTSGALTITQMLYCEHLNSAVVASYDNNIIFVSLPKLHVWKMLCGDNGFILATLFVTFPARTPKRKSKKDSNSKEEEESSDEEVTKDGQGGEMLVVASDSAELRAYRTDDLSCRLLRGHGDGVQALARHPANSEVFASSSKDRSVRVWRTTVDAGAVCVAVAEGHSSSVTTVALGLDIMVTGSQDTCIKSWKIDETMLTAIKAERSTMTPNSLRSAQTQVGHDKDINCVCVSRKDKLVATGSGDKTIKLWSGQDLSPVGCLRGHKRGVWSVQFSPVDKLLASAAADDTICIWLLDTMTLATSLDGQKCGLLTANWINNGLQLFSTSSTGLLKLWEVKTGVCLETLTGHENHVWGVDVRDDGDRIVTAGVDSRIVVWKDVTKEVIEREAEEKQKLQSEQQTLANLLRAERWEEALLLTLRLDQPYNSLKVIKGILRTSGRVALARLLNVLEEHQLGALIKYTALWNTRTSSCRYAQVILNLLLSTRLREELEKLPFWEQSLEALMSYTDRHYGRVTALRQSACILDLCVSSMTLSQGVEALTLDGQSLGQEDLVELDDKELLNGLRPLRKEAEDESSQISDSESEGESASESDGELTAEEKQALKKLTMAASDNERDSADDEMTGKETLKKKKKKSTKRIIEDLDNDYVKERIDETAEMSQEVDEGVDSGNEGSNAEDFDSGDEARDSAVAGEQFNGYNSDEEHERRMSFMSRGTGRGRGTSDDRQSRDRIADSYYGDQRFAGRGRGGSGDRSFRGGSRGGNFGDGGSFRGGSTGFRGGNFGEVGSRGFRGGRRGFRGGDGGSFRGGSRGFRGGDGGGFRGGSRGFRGGDGGSFRGGSRGFRGGSSGDRNEVRGFRGRGDGDRGFRGGSRSFRGSDRGGSSRGFRGGSRGSRGGQRGRGDGFRGRGDGFRGRGRGGSFRGRGSTN